MVDPREAARSLASELTGLYGDRLRSVLLHGSVARGEAVPGVSDINVFVLLEEIDPPALLAGAPLARRWAAAGNTPPLLMAWREWRAAADAFAIELADMKDAHELLRGTDPLDGLAIDRASLRLQAERELRGKLVQLREGMLLAADEPLELGRLLETALPSFTTYLRTVLRLAGRPVPRSSPDVIRAGSALIDADGEPLLRVWRARGRSEPLAARIDEPLTTGYYAHAERTTAFVDTLSERSAT